MKHNLEQLLEEGKEILTVLYEGDSPGSAGWIGISQYQNKYYVLTDFEENYGPYENLDNALKCEVFEHLSISFTLKSDTLTPLELATIKESIQTKSNQYN